MSQQLRLYTNNLTFQVNEIICEACTWLYSSKLRLKCFPSRLVVIDLARTTLRVRRLLRALTELRNYLVNFRDGVSDLALNFYAQFCIFKSFFQLCDAIHDGFFALIKTLQNLGKTNLLIHVAKVTVGPDQDSVFLLLRLQNVSESVFHALVGLLLHHLLEVFPVVVDAGESLLGES